MDDTLDADMLAISALPLNSTVSFDLHPAAILGPSIKGAKVLAYLDAASTYYFNIDPVAQHVNVFPFLPPGTPNQFDAYPYIKLKLASGAITCIGLPWIVDASLAVATTRQMQITIDNVTPAGQNLILAALSANGYGAVKVDYFD